MRIVIDMQGAQTESRFRGIGRYTMSFAKGVVRNCGEHEVILALSGLFPETIEPIWAEFQDLLPQENIRVWYAPGPVAEEHSGNDARRQVAEFIREAFLASLQPDVIHICSLFEGYVDDAVSSIGCLDKQIPVSVTLYDLIPLLNPKQYLTLNPKYASHYHRKIESLKQASLYLGISEFACREAVQNLGVEETTVTNISTAIDNNFKPLKIEEYTKAEVQHKFGISRSFVLYTGGADQRKNLPRLIEAYANLTDNLRQSHQLVFAGKMPDGDIAHFKQVAQESGLKPEELLFTGYVSDEELVQLYNLCTLYVFPSWHEGFGLPALEAMACGAAVIGANTSSLPEVIGLDEALFDPMDVSAIAVKISQALTDEKLRSRLRTHGIQRAKLFSWDVTAKKSLAAWEALSVRSRYSPERVRTGRKPRLAFVSPLPPEKTGIADYSAELLPTLAEHYDIEIVVEQENVTDNWIKRNCQIRNVAWLREHANHIDRVLYQMGNSPFHAHMLPLMQEIPGTVVMHDFYMSGLMAWLELHGGIDHSWTNALYAAHGYAAVRARFSDPEGAKRDYPVNLHPLQHAKGIIVHSQYSKHLAQTWYRHHVSADWEVIPQLLAKQPYSLDKKEVKRLLGFAADDFVICSFGFLDGTKLNHRLLQSWLSSTLSKEACCHLVFVGENHGGDYGNDLLRQIKESGVAERIRITGFASAELFRQYLVAADLGVQLRTLSRGETSRAVLDCMNHALPVIVNANGSMAELDKQAVWMLPDEFANDELINALETLREKPEMRHALGQRAQEVIHKQHAPSECARLYAEAIEYFHEHSQASLPSLLQAIAAGGAANYDDGELMRLSHSIATNMPLKQPARTIYLDITATFRNDLKTGIERVARALVLAMINASPLGFRIEPVYLDCIDGNWVYRYARQYTLALLECQTNGFTDEIVDPECGDVLIGMDLSGDTLIKADSTGLFAYYRNRGVMLFSIVYDLLPVRMSAVFPPWAEQIHKQWLETISKFDGAICISKAVADDLIVWKNEMRLTRQGQRPFKVSWFHLGADVANSAPSKGMPENAQWVLAQIQGCPCFLMVGTIEPRKGYLQVIDAFTLLWQENIDINLVIVGKEGWQGLPEDMRRDIPQTIQKLHNHPELNKHLFWLEGISDEYLEKVYDTSTCLIAASYGEGFGLPLIEAAQHKLPILARDIPVFREVAGEHASYFTAEQPEQLADAVRQWLNSYQKDLHPKSDQMPWLTWKESAKNLLKTIL